MPDIDKATLRNTVLEHLGVLSPGDTAPQAADVTLVERVIDAAYDELRKSVQIDFPLSAVPPWAQLGLRTWVAAECSGSFGKPMPQDEIERQKELAERQLAKQLAGFKHNVPPDLDFM